MYACVCVVSSYIFMYVYNMDTVTHNTKLIFENILIYSCPPSSNLFIKVQISNFHSSSSQRVVRSTKVYSNFAFVIVLTEIYFIQFSSPTLNMCSVIFSSLCSLNFLSVGCLTINEKHNCKYLSRLELNVIVIFSDFKIRKP